MQESLRDLYAALKAAVDVGAEAAERRDWDGARNAARIVLSAGSKLHAKLGVLVDLSADGYWTAEVDRAVAKAKKELPGQTSIEDFPPAAPKRKRPRKGEGA